MTRRAVRPLVVAAAAFACAQPGSPPGGEPDNEPPRVVEVVPGALDTITELDEPVVIRFDERLSERLEDVQDWREGVLVSPVTSPVRVRAGRRSLTISLVRGWEADQVYRVIVLPVFRDLFNNRRVEPLELVFSTGAPISDAALAGFVTDRLTGRAVAGARIEAVRRIDQVTYVALSDTAGFFAMRYMPAGAYDLRAWHDQDRDLAADFFEIQDSADLAFGVRDTAVVELALLRPDTTPARLARASVIDSAKVRLLFDDYFPPGPVAGQAWLHSLPDSALITDGALVHATRLDSILAAEAPAVQPDSAPAPADSVGAVADTARAAPPARSGSAARTARTGGRSGSRSGGQGGSASPPGPPLPSQELILLLARPLLPDTAYFVRVQGVTNIRGVPGGGGAAAFTTPPDTVVADTLPVDTLPVDTLPVDTIRP